MRMDLSFVTMAIVAGMGCTNPPGTVLRVYPATSPDLAQASTDAASGLWESAPWTPGPQGWLEFPARGEIQVEHSLGRTPRGVWVYLSFQRGGMSPVLAAGDLARIVDVDDTTVTVWNATSGPYFARLVVQ